MRATITLQTGVKVDVDTSFEEIMRIATETGASVFIPACLCGKLTAFPCSQHRPPGVLRQQPHGGAFVPTL